tara:strand:- start:92 stop:409 length:318 start_codon:yes stop_codon:yes gene_type:complete
MQYQERFVKQRNELLNHYGESFDVTGVADVFDNDYELLLRVGVRDFIVDKKYFEFSSQESQAIENNNLFADDSAKRIERNWKNKSIDEVVRVVKDKVEVRKRTVA